MNKNTETYYQLNLITHKITPVMGVKLTVTYIRFWNENGEKKVIHRTTNSRRIFATEDIAKIWRSENQKLKPIKRLISPAKKYRFYGKMNTVDEAIVLWKQANYKPRCRSEIDVRISGGESLESAIKFNPEESIDQNNDLMKIAMNIFRPNHGHTEYGVM